MWEVVGTIVVTVAMMVLAYLFTRYVVGGLGANMGRGKLPGALVVVSEATVGRDCRLVLARLGEKVYVLGVTPHGITLLDQLTHEELEALEQAQPPQGATSFSTALQQVLEQWKHQRRP